MKKSVAFLLFLTLGLLLSSSSSFKETTLSNFSLKNIDGKKVALSDYKNAKGFMVVFICNKCPMAKFYSERLNNLNIKFKSQGVPLLAINAMDTLAYAEESFALMQKKAKKEKLNFPYLQDKSQVVVKKFKAKHTPQAFVIWKNSNSKYVIKYEGAIDDNAGESEKATPFLEKSVTELLAGKTVQNPKTESFGCRIFIRGEKNIMN